MTRDSKPELEEGQEVKRMDVKGAKALSERLAEAARNVDPPPAQAVGSEDTTDREYEVADTATRAQVSRSFRIY